MALPILKLPTELQLMVINNVDCLHDCYNLVMELDLHYKTEEFLNYFVSIHPCEVIAPWLKTNNMVFKSNCYIVCHCPDCDNDRKRDHARMMCEEYDYHS